MSIQAIDLSVKRGKSLVLDHLDFTIHPGTVTGLIGPSGSGKTTLMRAIVGVQEVTEGKLVVLDQPAGSTSLRRVIGYMSQDVAVYDDLTVRQNLDYFAKLTATSKEQVTKTLHNVQLSDQEHRLVTTLSGGQKARVGLAVALLGDPKVLIMDEPTVGLDPLLREELWSLFRKLAEGGKTLFVSSHVMDEAEKCDSLLLLREGKLLWHDSREELLKKTKVTTVQDAFMKMIKGDVL